MKNNFLVIEHLHALADPSGALILQAAGLVEIELRWVGEDGASVSVTPLPGADNSTDEEP